MATSFEQITALLGHPVEDLHGVTVGRVDDLLIDRENGHIAYVRFVFDVSGNPGDPRLTVPWSAIRVIGNGQHVLQVMVEKAALTRLARAGPG